MATVYSLVCWGGLTGKTVSISASTDIVTLTNHGLRNGTKLWPSGTLPSELNTSTPVYARSTGANAFTLHTSAAGAIANTGQILFAGSSTYAAVTLKSDLVASPSTALAAYGLSDLSRWGGTRVYDGLQSAVTVRASASLVTDDEVIEVAEAFDEIYNNQLVVQAKSLSFTIHSRIGTKRTPAFHSKNINEGFRYVSTNVGGCYTPNCFSTVADGIQFITNTASSGGYSMITPGTLAFDTTIRNCIVRSIGTGAFYGVTVTSALKFYNNIVTGLVGTTYGAIYITNGLGCYIYNNTVVKNGIGMRANDSTHGLIYNNLVVGNTSNWRGAPSYQSVRCLGNLGEVADKIPFTATAASSTLVCSAPHYQTINSIVFLQSTGTLPTVAGVPLSETTPYFIRSSSGANFTIATAYNGTALVFDGVGSGTHTLNTVWSTSEKPPGWVDLTTPSDTFVDWSNNDFNLSSSALPVDAGKSIIGLVGYDIGDGERPNYNNGGAEAVDVGCYEFDHGFGPHPASHTLTLTNVVVGSRVHIRDQADTVTHYDDIASASSVVIPITVYGDSRDNWRIKVRKASAAPYYQPWETIMTATAGASSIYVSQIPD